jgi:hypothetical protein
MTKLFKFFALTAAAAVLFGCSSSDSGGSGTPPPTTGNISGVVIDPPIKDARIELWSADGVANFCGVNKNTICQSITNEEGRFILTVDSGRDLSGFYIITYGGVDTVYGTDFSGISLYSPLSLFDTVNESIIVSPITSIVNSIVIKQGDLSAAVAKTAAALEIPESDVASSPLNNATLLKASYLVVKTAELINSEGTADPLAKIAAAVEASSAAIAKDSFLDKLFEVSEITDATVIASVKGEVQRLKTLLDAVANSSNTGALAEQILDKERRAVFKEAVKTSINVPPSPADLFNTSVDLLYNKLAALVNNLPTNQFAAAQLVRFVVYQDGFFGDYDNYIGTSFTSTLNDLIPTDAEEKAAFIASIAAISKESIYLVNAPLAEALGDDNAKRVNYYFRSNADANYKARKILESVYNDEVNDAISDSIIESYALHGFHEKAREIANYYVRTTANRIRAYRYIGNSAAIYDKTAAKSHLDYGKAYMDAAYQAQGQGIYTNNSAMGNYINYYTLYMRAYDKAEEHETAQEVRDFIINTMLANFNGSAANQNTRWQSFFNALGLSTATTPCLIEQLITEGDFANALLTADYYIKAARDEFPQIAAAKTEAGSAVITNANLYRLQVTHSSKAAEHYWRLANSENAEAIKAKIAAIKTSVDTYLLQPTTVLSNTNRIYIAYLAGPVYWAMGESATDNLIANLSDASRKRQAYYGIANAKAEEEGFDAALAWYLTKNPVVADFSNISETYGIIDAFSYNGSWDVGIGIQAHRHGRDDIAEAAADYLMGVLDDAVVYYTNNSSLSDKAPVLVASASIYPIGASYPISAPDHERGYLKAGTVYALAGKPEKAKAALQKAEVFVDALTAAPYTQGQYYSVLGYYYLKLAGDQAASEAAYAKAAAKLSELTLDENKRDFNLLLAYNAYYRSALTQDGKKTLIDGYLQTASTLADAIYTVGVDDTAVEDENSAFLKIAARYASINESEKVKAALEKAESNIAAIAEASTQLSQKQSIYIAYAKLYSIDSAVEKANEISLTADRNTVLQNIATSVASADDFPTSALDFVSYNVDSGRIAFSDTDKDGKPDFFVPWATLEQIAASGLTLDDDIDGDGKPDTTDLTPFFAD